MALLKVKVVPGASRSEIVGRHADGIRVRVAAPPEAGRANQELLDLLAAALGAKRAALRIVRGETSPQKVVDVDDLSFEEMLRRLRLGD
jgi:uncharacterized protein (TIGR00251 family)